MKKSTRTISGVTPLAVMTRPMQCPGRCVCCPTYPETPQSYTPESPAVLRAISCGYDATEQIRLRLRALSAMGHPTDKIELIVMGGTFLAAPVEYQYRFIKDCFDALNGTASATLEEAQRLNEESGCRCVGLCIETRPDWCGPEEAERMLEFGTTRVELGVQALDDDIYRLIRRGHTVSDVIRATGLLKGYGFKVHYHWMPGLPGSTPQLDLEMAGRLFNDADFRPDGLKLYPTMVVAGTELEQWYRQGRYLPYDDDTMINLIVDIKSIVPGYVRISRVLRDIPAKYIVGGLKDSLRGEVRRRMKERGIECRCIRCREYGHRARDGWETGEPRMVRTDYSASGGREVFLSFEDDNETLFGLLRMRVVGLPDGLRQGSAMIRELHVYGPEIPLGQRSPQAAQHRGLGRALLAEAERIAAADFGVRQMVVLSGVGAREYYRAEFGYRAQGSYMVRALPGAQAGPALPRRCRNDGRSHASPPSVSCP
ncbi:MAG: tRNA uridine(34) 5-carboxymethylaminomethyl modification radical SAM/GNAT enzyme Elp3 [Dehalococcoidales bacterium]|nr:tRNA uridine(34) 5-carboxymethylaminomethyl modification radical SAM/GNAT enzyme Elp3 [Dehalococcoidales bacterium]